MIDFPAAHSMDTDWFAVDADGNLAMFESGEGGAVPEGARDYDFEEFVQYFPKNEKGIIHIPTAGSIVAKGADLQSLWEDIKYDCPMFDLVLVLASEETIEELEYNTCLRFVGEEIVIWIDSCPQKIIQNLIEKKQIISRKCDFDLYSNTHLFGVYNYCVPQQFPAPYERNTNLPSWQIKLSDLPEGIEREIKPLSLKSLKFSEIEKYQPIEHMPCRTWGGAIWWRDCEGNEREGHPYPYS